MRNTAAKTTFVLICFFLLGAHAFNHAPLDANGNQVVRVR